MKEKIKNNILTIGIVGSVLLLIIIVVMILKNIDFESFKETKKQEELNNSEITSCSVHFPDGTDYSMSYNFYIFHKDNKTIKINLLVSTVAKQGLFGYINSETQNTINSFMNNAEEEFKGLSIKLNDDDGSGYAYYSGEIDIYDYKGKKVDKVIEELKEKYNKGSQRLECK